MRTWSSASRSRWNFERQLEPLGDVERLEQLDLLLVVRVGRVAARVGQRAGLGDAAHERRDAAVVAAQLEDLLDHRAILALEVAGAAVDRDRVGVLLDLDEQAAVGKRVGGAGDSAVEALERDGAGAAGQADAVGDLGDGADGGEVLLVPGHEQHALLLAGVHGERERHAREDDGVVQRDQKKSARHGAQIFTFDSCLPEISRIPVLRAGVAVDLSHSHLD